MMIGVMLAIRKRLLSRALPGANQYFRRKPFLTLTGPVPLGPGLVRS